MHHEWNKDGYRICTDPELLDPDAVHRFLTNSYWSPGVPKEVVQRAIKGSLCFGVYQDRTQVGMARVITDYATFAYICDLFIIESHQAKGLGKWLMDVIVNHPELQGFRRWILATRDAHGLYAKFGFKPLRNPDRHMERWNPDVYKKP